MSESATTNTETGFTFFIKAANGKYLTVNNRNNNRLEASGNDFPDSTQFVLQTLPYNGSFNQFAFYALDKSASAYISRINRGADIDQVEASKQQIDQYCALTTGYDAANPNCPGPGWFFMQADDRKYLSIYDASGVVLAKAPDPSNANCFFFLVPLLLDSPITVPLQTL